MKKKTTTKQAKKGVSRRQVSLHPDVEKMLETQAKKEYTSASGLITMMIQERVKRTALPQSTSNPTAPELSLITKTKSRPNKTAMG